MDRKEFIGASEVAALLDSHPFKKPIDIYNEKMGLTEDKPTSKSAHLGNCLEEGLLKFFCDMSFKCEYSDYQTHLRHGHAGATLDAVLRHGSYKRRKFSFAPIDIKTIGLTGTLPYHTHYGKGGTDEVPLHVYYQLQMQMHLCVQKWGDEIDLQDGFIGLLGLQGQGLKIYRVAYKEHVGHMLTDAVEAFWEKHIVTQTPPEEGETTEEVLF